MKETNTNISYDWNWVSARNVSFLKWSRTSTCSLKLSWDLTELDYILVQQEATREFLVGLWHGWICISKMPTLMLYADHCRGLLGSGYCNMRPNERQRTGLGCCVCVLSCFSCVQLFVVLWTVAHQASLSMGFWTGLPCPPSGYLPIPRIKP